MFLLGLAMLIVSILGFIVSSAIYITCLGISKMLKNIEEVYIRNEKRKSVNISNKELIKK
jgi:hypothetical protein